MSNRRKILKREQHRIICIPCLNMPDEVARMIYIARARLCDLVLGQFGRLNSHYRSYESLVVGVSSAHTNFYTNTTIPNRNGCTVK
jgi:hypothetical protein